MPDVAVRDSGAAARDSTPPFPGGRDPIGFLLERKDSLLLTQDVVDRLVQINLDLFRRNARLQMRIDSIAPPPPEQSMRGPETLPPEVRERLRPLVAERNTNVRRAAESAFAMLTPEQQERARQLELRERSRMGRERSRRPGG